ncbi:MAG: insulinase family protein [Bdellovibrionales bacterium]|nr:insulinase family protein [Bdellovibrionales bacterium]
MNKKYKLKNGLTVLLSESHKSPVVTIQMWVRTGSADEPEKVRGISHFIEHLVFKGTQKYKVGEIAKTIEASGGEINAYTSFDQTVFYVTLSKQYLSTGLDIIAEMMGNPTFDPEEVNREREVVLEEIKRGLDSSHRQAHQLLFSSIFKSHPYGKPVIGYEEIIRNVGVETIRNYFHKKYNAQNMTLFIVGDIEVAEIKPLIATKFSTFKKGPKNNKKRIKEQLLQRQKVVIKESPFKENFLFLSWPTPKVSHRDIVALDVLNIILGQGESSRLNQKLHLEKALVHQIGSSLFAAQDPGFISIAMTLSNQDFSVALKEIELELDRFIKQPPDEEELSKALTNLQSEQFYSLETVEGQTRVFGHFEFLFGDYQYFEKYLKQVNKIKQSDLLSVFKKYFKKDRMIVCALMGESCNPSSIKDIRSWAYHFKPNYSQSAKIRKSLFVAKNKKSKQKGFSKPSEVKSSDENMTHRFLLKNGATLLLRPNYDTPVVNLKLALLGGSRLENKPSLGISELLSRTWVSATQFHKENEIMDGLDRIASSLSSFSGKNSLGLSLTTLNPYLKPILDIFSEVLLHNIFQKDIVEREKVQMLEQIQLRDDNPVQKAILNFNAKIFGDHPYGRDPLGSKETLTQISPTHLEKYHHQIRTSQNLVLSITGHFNLEETKNYLEELLQKLPHGEKLLKTIPPEVIKQKLEHFSFTQKEQTHIVIGYRGLTLSSPDKYTLYVLESLLSGQGGRLFLELRDKASLAYSVAPLRLEGLETGYFGAYIGCSPDKGKKAIAMLKEQFEKLKNERVSSHEIERSKKYLIGRHDIDLQKNSSINSLILFDEIYGLDEIETHKFAHRIQAVSSDNIQSLAQKIFSQPEIISAVGPTTPF